MLYVDSGQTRRFEILDVARLPWISRNGRWIVAKTTLVSRKDVKDHAAKAVVVDVDSSRTRTLDILDFKGFRGLVFSPRAPEAFVITGKGPVLLHLESCLTEPFPVESWLRSDERLTSPLDWARDGEALAVAFGPSKAPGGKPTSACQGEKHGILVLWRKPPGWRAKRFESPVQLPFPPRGCLKWRTSRHLLFTGHVGNGDELWELDVRNGTTKRLLPKD